LFKKIPFVGIPYANLKWWTGKIETNIPDVLTQEVTKMKTRIKLTLAFIISASFILTAMVQNSETTEHRKHDFSNGGTSNPCITCHTPSSAGNLEVTPLWNTNRKDLNRYVRYARTFEKTALSLRPRDGSLICLGCHNGSSHALAVDPSSGHQEMGKNYKIKSAMTNDHPIATYYPVRNRRNYNTPPDALNGWTDVKLYDGKVECTSCHDPHDTSKKHFLRIDNHRSALCLRCHRK
jgi:predicted CXXCH cytochrome family protein